MHLERDLNCSRYEVMMIAVHLEQELGIVITEEDLDEVKHLFDFKTLVDSALPSQIGTTRTGDEINQAILRAATSALVRI